MTGKIVNQAKKLFIVSLLALTLTVVFGFITEVAVAYEEPESIEDVSNITLKEKDFQFYVKFFTFLTRSPKPDPEEFFKNNNVSKEYIESVTFKITLNAIAIFTGDEEELANSNEKEFVFTPAEAKLFKKYEERISTLLTKLPN
jgi:hypothetical protein